MEIIACIDKCDGCNSVVEEEGKPNRCTRYANPPAVWTRLGGCPMCSTGKAVGEQKERFIDPLKASKKKMKGVR